MRKQTMILASLAALGFAGPALATEGFSYSFVELGWVNQEFDDLDVLELTKDGLLVIEWGEAVESALPQDHLRIEFEIREDESRLLRFVGEGAWSERKLDVAT